jgi:hypothetical protein
MQKLIRAVTTSMMLTTIGIGLVGCADESGVESKTKITGPSGTTTVTEKTNVKKTGDNPPAVPSDTKTP